MRLLAHVRTTEAFAALLDFVKDRDAEFADAAVRALGRFPPAKALPHSRRMANDNSLATKLRATALWALGKFKRAEDRLLLRGLAADPSWSIRRVVVGALSAYRHPEDAAIVRKLTRDRDETVRSSAIRFIGRWGQPEDRHLHQKRAHPGRIRASIDPAAAKRELLRAIHVTCMDLVVNLRSPNSLRLKPL